VELPQAAKRLNVGRVREFSHTEKQQLLAEWEAGDVWQRWELEWKYNLDKQKRYRWKQALSIRAALPTKQRPAMCAQRHYGQNGRNWAASNPREVEQQIYDAVIGMRDRRLPVSMKQLRALAIKFRVDESFKASAKFALSFVHRWRISLRARTTSKDISSARVLRLAMGWHVQFWKNKFAVNNTIDTSCLWNMDETSVYLDMPPSKTLDLVGAKSVEIASTQHDCTRVAVVLCCNRTGEMLDPLIVHKCGKNSKHQNDVNNQTITTKDGKVVSVFVTKNETGWLNGILMQKWIRLIFTPAMQRRGRPVEQQYLFMDNCPAHTTADVWNAMTEGGFCFEFFHPTALLSSSRAT